MWKDTPHIFKVVCISAKQISPKCKPCMLCSIDSKWFFTSSSAKASLNDQDAIWKVNNLIIVGIHVLKCETHHMKDIITLTMSTEMKNVDTKCIPGYRVTNTCKMLPLQNLDEEWGICRMPCDSCTCMWVCLGGRDAEWITHSKREEPHQEVVWCNVDIMGKPKDCPQKV